MIVQRHWIAGLSVLGLVLAGSELLAQHRIPFLSSPPNSGEAGGASLRPATFPAGGQGRLSESEPVPDLPGQMAPESAVFAHDPLDDDCFCDACGGAGQGGEHGHGLCADSCRICYRDGWVQGEYLMWWPRPMDIPPLVTSGTTASEGVLGGAGTETLVGGQVLDQLYSGGRLRLGIWTDPCHDYAWEVEGFIIGEASDRYSFSGTGAAGTGVIARPFFNVLNSTAFPNGREDVEFVAFPGQLSGTVSVEATSELYGVGIHAMRTLDRAGGCDPATRHCGSVPVGCDLTGFLGWRYLNLGESLQINEALTSLLPAPENGQFLIEDRFETRNAFNGVDMGVMWNRRRGPLSLDLLMRMAVGTNHQEVHIAGTTTIRGSADAGNNFENARGGILAQRTNIGDYSRDRFAVVPELGVTLGYALSPQWRATFGYTFLYFSSVVRPGDQIDRDVNPNLFPPETVPFTGLERPVFTFVESGLWVNGLNLGLERTW